MATAGSNDADTYSGTEDASISGFSATTPAPSGTTYLVASAGTRQVLIKFTGLDGLSGTVSDSTFFVFVGGAGLSLPVGLDFHVLLRAWIDTEATHTVWTTGNNWTTAGARGDNTDRETTASLVNLNIPNDDAVYRSLGSAGLDSDMQDIIDNDGATDGWGIYNNGTGGITLSSSEAVDGQRPYIEFTLTADGGRTMGSLAGLGGLAGMGGLAGAGGGLAG